MKLEESASAATATGSNFDAMHKPAPRATDAETIRQEILEKLAYSIGKDPIVAKSHDWLAATILALRDRIIDRWMESTRATYQAKDKRVYYLSLEFLIGRLLRDALGNLELTAVFEKALASLNVDLDLVESLEPDAALGNGGLGRLAACFMESMASLDIPAYGYGIRYDHGLFRQKIIDGWQVELPENWLENGNFWEFPRREAAYEVGFGGTVMLEAEADGKQRRRWRAGRKHTGQRLRHAGGRLARQTCQHTQAVDSAGHRPHPPRCLQLRRLRGGSRRKQQGRNHHPGALPVRLDAGRPGTASQAGVFLHLGFAAGHSAPPFAAISAR